MVSNPTLSTVRSRILETARQRFFREGFARITMDILARELGMSKKTLYQHFPSKAALVAALMQSFREEVASVLGQITSDASLPLLERIACAFAEGSRRLRQIERPFLEDLARFLPEVWAETERFRAETITRYLGQVLEEGRRAGLVRTDLPIDFMLRSFLAATERLVTPMALAELPYTLSEVIRLLIRLFFEGVLTDAARTDFRKAIAILADETNPPA